MERTTPSHREPVRSASLLEAIDGLREAVALLAERLAPLEPPPPSPLPGTGSHLRVVPPPRHTAAPPPGSSCRCGRCGPSCAGPRSIAARCRRRLRTCAAPNSWRPCGRWRSCSAGSWRHEPPPFSAAGRPPARAGAPPAPPPRTAANCRDPRRPPGSAPPRDGGEQALTRLDQQGPQQEKKDLRSTNMVGILPDDAIMRLVGIQLLEQQEEWRLKRRRSFSDVTMVKKPELGMALMLTDVATVGQATIASN